MNKLKYVNPLQGAASTFSYSSGNTLPLITRPFGMASWSPQTNEVSGGWFFHPDHRTFEGLRLTHQPSPWIGDYGHLAVMPQSGPLYLAADRRASSFRPEDRIVKPDYVRYELLRYGIELELTPAIRGACMRLRFKRKEEAARLILAPFNRESRMEILPEKRRIVGFTRGNVGGAPDNFAMYFVIDFDCSIDETQSGVFDGSYTSYEELTRIGERTGAFVGLELPESGTVNVKIGTSFISVEQAIRNLRIEIAAKSFEEIRDEATAEWERYLGRIEVEDEDEEKLRTFYSCLYRTGLFPRIWHEFDEEGRKVHYSPYTGKVHEGPMYSDNGFWDTYRTENPLLALLAPTILSEILQSWVNVYRESGWMPKWVSPGERSGMPGTLIDAVFADAFVKGIRNFDVELAYEGLRKHALEQAPQPHLGRKGFSDYAALGYLPSDRYHESVNNTLDYIYGDFCIAQMARGLGKQEDYKLLMARARGYSKLFDPTVGFMRPLKEDGSREEPFDPLAWGGAYCEGGPWQCSWAVQHDVLGLAQAAGGRELFKAKLDELMTMAPTFRIGSYPIEIHEMSEMAAVDFGQFAISNQPSFHIPYLFTAIGYPAEAQYWVRRAAEELFSAKPDGFPGDEDNGSMGAWYVFAALGLYPLCPGVPEYVLGSPMFTRATLHLENGNNISLRTEGHQPANRYVKKLLLNGEPISRLYVTHQELTRGAELRFVMSGDPAAKAHYDETDLPYSLSGVARYQ
ncbi:GH92 family glycosyl hydrolase [Paenibacillus timonensis]|uniref:GH92 family glycosyl hydrolase n=1 Tax=Paenibacillus timonensis TaxID=225915 RepID=UPI003F966D35